MPQLTDYRLLGRSGLRVSPLALGTMTFGGAAWGSDDTQSARILDHYVDRGGNFLDTANFYGNMGGSEELLGKIVGDRRDRLVIATKFALTMRPGDPNASGNHRKHMMLAVEDSLRRLKTDYLDVFYLHVWDDRTPVDEILRSFDDLVRAGKVRYIGLSDTPVWQAARMQTMAELRGWTQFAALQIPYNLTRRDVESDLIPMAAELGMGVIPWSPLAGGVLAAKYDPAEAEVVDHNVPVTRRVQNLRLGKLTGRNLEIATAAAQVADEIGATPAQIALAWTLQNSAVVSPIMGARTFEQLQDNLGALDVVFSPAQLKALDEVSAVQFGFPHDFLASEHMLRNFGAVNVEKRRHAAFSVHPRATG